MAIATLASGCFWCTEAVVQRLRGVEAVVSGYTGGARANPTYEEVCTGRTGHAEAVQVTFDPAIIAYEDLLHVYFKTHDPTTLNRQGADVGTQYRSAIFYHDEEQKETAERVIRELTESKEYDAPIVTEITPASDFYVAEDYHMDFYNRNREYGYCRVVIDPKVQKLYKEFSGALAT
ncbi:MAG: peptide-methionine (S)-S-oxide reductase MsrA [Dehalococcoidia bacterium]